MKFVLILTYCPSTIAPKTVHTRKVIVNAESADRAVEIGRGVCVVLHRRGDPLGFAEVQEVEHAAPRPVEPTDEISLEDAIIWAMTGGAK